MQNDIGKKNMRTGYEPNFMLLQNSVETVVQQKIIEKKT